MITKTNKFICIKDVPYYVSGRVYEEKDDDLVFTNYPDIFKGISSWRWAPQAIKNKSKKRWG